MSNFRWRRSAIVSGAMTDTSRPTRRSTAASLLSPCAEQEVTASERHSGARRTSRKDLRYSLNFSRVMGGWASPVRAQAIEWCMIAGMRRKIKFQDSVVPANGSSPRKSGTASGEGSSRADMARSWLPRPAYDRNSKTFMRQNVSSSREFPYPLGLRSASRGKGNGNPAG